MTMSASISDPSIPWNRVLPKPPTLLNDRPDGPFGKRNISLLNHHTVSERYSKDLLESGTGRRSTVPSISYPQMPSSSLEFQLPSRESDTNASISTDRSSLGSLARKRTLSLMADEPRSREQSPSNQSAIIEPLPQFCLCQPEPKIPRPRNGELLFPISQHIVQEDDELIEASPPVFVE